MESFMSKNQAFHKDRKMMNCLYLALIFRPRGWNSKILSDRPDCMIISYTPLPHMAMSIYISLTFRGGRWFLLLLSFKTFWACNELWWSIRVASRSNRDRKLDYVFITCVTWFEIANSMSIPFTRLLIRTNFKSILDSPIEIITNFDILD